VICTPEIGFGGIAGVPSRFHVLHSLTHFRRYRGCRVLFSFFVRPDSFSAVLRASGPVFMLCATGLIFGDTKGIPSRFHVVPSRTCFWRYQGRRVLFSLFALPNSFFAVSSVSGPVFMFCAPELVFGSTDGVGSRFLDLHARNRFRWYRGRPFPFSCFALLDSFSAVPRVSGHVFIFCPPGLVFGCTEGVGSRFHVVRS
jgi:hypothetical protein